ncbi:hypothetical protein FHR84_001583 [Actinopolyspora biskrensis]|uniref:Uncharacterized protein n=1 Tax=Actinopolyspora biskrensis TaxID=1470178 RepID=A0A852YU93_9ACTN|nr:hypothetical protein [Actinopolyspora biskrensis]NYH78261.1 hypothetical protein [Actinopolyspora biskrensis]
MSDNEILGVEAEQLEPLGSFSSAESARDLFGLTRELRLVWLPEA